LVLRKETDKEEGEDEDREGGRRGSGQQRNGAAGK
jgi:hypothetical protein